MSHSLSKCMEKGCDAPPDHDCIWADGRARAWFCDAHYGPWSKGTEGDLDREIIKSRQVKDGKVSKKYGDSKKALLEWTTEVVRDLPRRLMNQKYADPIRWKLVSKPYVSSAGMGPTVTINLRGTSSYGHWLVKVEVSKAPKARLGSANLMNFVDAPQYVKGWDYQKLHMDIWNISALLADAMGQIKQSHGYIPAVGRLSQAYQKVGSAHYDTIDKVAKSWWFAEKHGQGQVLELDWRDLRRRLDRTDELIQEAFVALNDAGVDHPSSALAARKTLSNILNNWSRATQGKLASTVAEFWAKTTVLGPSPRPPTEGLVVPRGSTDRDLGRLMGTILFDVQHQVWSQTERAILKMGSQRDSSMKSLAPDAIAHEMAVYKMWARSHAAAVRTAGETGDGTSVGLFIPLPESLAKQYPTKDKDTSPAHTTFLYVGNVTKDQEKLLVDALHVFFAGVGPVRAALGELDHFMNHDAKVVFSRIRFSRDLNPLRDTLREYLTDLGFEIADSFPRWNPHVTVAYIGHNENLKLIAPSGTWDFDGIELWGLSQKHEISFGMGAPLRMSPAPEIGSRRMARIMEKRGNAARLRHRWG